MRTMSNQNKKSSSTSNRLALLLPKLNGKLDECLPNVNYTDSREILDEMPVKSMHFTFIRISCPPFFASYVAFVLC